MSDRMIDVFPPGNELALFVVALCAAATDVQDADGAAREANTPGTQDDPHHSHRERLTYHVRRALGHLYEGILALKAWRGSARVRDLLGQLSPEGKKRLDQVCRLDKTVGRDPLRSVRNNSFHYARPGTGYDPDPVDDLADAIRKNPDTPTGFDVVISEAPTGYEDPPPRRIYRFADQMQTSIAFGEFDEKKASEQIGIVQGASDAFLDLVDEVFDLYCKQRGVERDD